MGNVVYTTRRAKRASSARAEATFVTPDGKRHRYLNAAIPRHADGTFLGPLVHSLCDTCGHGYSELIVNGRHLCGECRLDLAAAHAAAVQEEMGADLGWASPDPVTDREKYGWNDQELRSIDHSDRMRRSGVARVAESATQGGP